MARFNSGIGYVFGVMTYLTLESISHSKSIPGEEIEPHGDSRGKRQSDDSDTRDTRIIGHKLVNNINLHKTIGYSFCFLLLLFNILSL